MTLLKGNLLTSVGVGVGTTQPESVTEAVPLWSWDHKLAIPSMARLGTLRPEEAKRAFSDFILIILKAASF